MVQHKSRIKKCIGRETYLVWKDKLQRSFFSPPKTELIYLLSMLSFPTLLLAFLSFFSRKGPVSLLRFLFCLPCLESCYCPLVCIILIFFLSSIIFFLNHLMYVNCNPFSFGPQCRLFFIALFTSVSQCENSRKYSFFSHS